MYKNVIMKAAVLYKFGQPPRYDDFPDPVPANDNQVVIKIKAASVKNLDKGRASGAHYGSHDTLPAVVGVDGVGELEDGTLVYAMGITGMIAEKALADKARMVRLPAGMDCIAAAALPNVVIGAALALRFRAGMESGKTVLINGATGVTGKAAVQIAKFYGAEKVIATGRNPESLSRLAELGADEVISLNQEDSFIIKRTKEINQETPIDIVIDYLWGRPAELILTALKGGGLQHISNTVKFVTVGEMAGANIQLPSGLLRSTAIEILGSGFGSLSREALALFTKEILPQMMQLNMAGKLSVDTQVVALKDIETAWQINDNTGKRIVVVP